jgi:ABC-2 type transport system permease protein
MKASVIAKHEFLVNAKRKEFIISTIGLPAFLVTLFLVISVAVSSSMPDVVKAGFVDNSGLLKLDKIERTIEEQDIFTKTTKKRKAILYRFENEDEAKKALLAGEIDAYFVIPEDFVQSFKIKEIYSKITPYFVAETLEIELAKVLAGDIGAKIAEGIKVESEKIGKGKEEFLDFMAPMFFGLLLFIAIFTSSGYLMQGIVEEKESRIMEILLSSVSARELFVGKLIGLSAVGFLQISVWLTLALMLSPILAISFMNLKLLVVSLIYFILGYAVYASLMAMVGVISPTLKDAQQLLSVLVFVALSPVFLAEVIILNPESTVSLVASLFPLTAPVVMPMRIATTEVGYEFVLSIAILIASIVLIVMVAMKLFEAYSLVYTKPKLKEILKVLR